MTSDIGLVDTNILIYSDDVSSIFHQEAKRLIEDNIDAGSLVLSQQNLTEFFAITTDPRRSPKPQSANDRKILIANWLKSGIFRLILPTPNTMVVLYGLIEKFPASGQDIFDVYLAATMLDNGIKTIYTADTKIFSKLGLRAINPLKM